MTVQKQKTTIKRLVYGRTLLVILALLLQVALLLSSWLSFLEKIYLVTGGVALFTVVMLIWVLNTRENPTMKLSWCVLIAIAPLFGTVVYLFFKLDIGHRASRRLIQRSIAESEKYLPDTGAETEAIRDSHPQLYATARYLQNCGAPLCPAEEVQYFSVGEDMFRQMLLELEKAEKFIFLEYFAIAPSSMWDEILAILERKARQGVEVRVLYDGGCAVSYFPHDYPQILAEKGIQCKVFSPFQILVSTHYNNRDHRKITVIDGKTAFTGGVNILDRYINRKEVFGHWKDTAVLVRGAAAREFTRMFLQMWNLREKEADYQPYLPKVEGKPSQGYVIPFGDGPHSDQRMGKMVYLNMLNQARDYVYIMTPYLILDNEMVTALQFAAQRGVDVRLILPHIPDKKYAFALAKTHYEELISSGVRIYEYTPGFIHAKTFLCDGHQAVVGTINLDYRSLYLHYECAAYLYDVSALQDVHRDFLDTFEISQEITLSMAQKRSVLSRLTGFLLKIAAPLM
jgi:cardiolipin synthase